MSVDDSLASLPPTAPGGGDFGAPVTNRTDTVDESNIGGPSRLKLKVRPSPPQYPYADTFFALEYSTPELLEPVCSVTTDCIDCIDCIDCM